jgi:processive 1,2-diacylglycerol beta-glucosyltransferase
MNKTIIVFTTLNVENLARKNYTFLLRIKSNLDSNKIQENYDVKYVKLTDISWDIVTSGDIFIFYKAHFFLKSIFMLVNVLKKINKKVIFDLDDYYLKLPIYSFSQHLNSGNRLLHLKNNIENTDIVTVSTQYLRDQILKYNSNTIVCENTIDTRDFQKPSCDIDVINILITSSDNLKLNTFKNGFLQCLQLIKNEFGNKIRICFLGKFSNIDNLYDFSDTFCDRILPTDYLNFLKNNNFHIGLVPLGAEEDPETLIAHSSKSNIKFLEFASNGIAGIYSDIEPYKMVENHKNGLIVKNSITDWYSAIKELILNHELRNNIIINSQETVKEQYCKDISKEKWFNILNSIEIENHQITNPRKKSIIAFFLLEYVIITYYFNLLHQKLLFLQMLMKRRDYREIRFRFIKIIRNMFKLKSYSSLR